MRAYVEVSIFYGGTYIQYLEELVQIIWFCFVLQLSCYKCLISQKGNAQCKQEVQCLENITTQSKLL